MKRLDVVLVEIGLAPSRAKAQELIERGLVTVRGNVVSDKAFGVSDKDIGAKVIQIVGDDFLKFVSRSGHKLEAALKELNLDPAEMSCLDVGASTGGFSDCLIQAKARYVVAFDVGHDQLHQRLQQSSQLLSIEGLNVKDIATHEMIPDHGFDLVVGDLSFISIMKALSFLVPKIKVKGHLLFLIKPQFEVGRVGLDKNGIVKGDIDLEPILETIKQEVISLGLSQTKIFASALAGRDGNQEYFLYGQRLK